MSHKPGTTTKFEDSNIANIGSKADHELRYNSALKEHAWSNAGQKEGTQIWRIEKFQVHEWPANKHGQFFSGDAYIVLKTYKPDPKAEKLAWNVHFWLGQTSSQDEQGTAAYKTVELDEFLKGLPVQYREVQGYESEIFHQLFPHLIYLDGGIDTGFSHVKPEEYKPRLMKFSGRHIHSVVRVNQVPLKLDSLDDGEVFILDAGLNIYQWNGTKSSVEEKRKADKVIHHLVEDRMGKPKHVVLDGLEDNKDFWAFFGGKPSKINFDPKADEKAEASAIQKSLWKLSDASGSLQLSKVATGKDIKKSMLTSDDVFLYDVGSSLYVFVGAKTSPGEKKNAINYAVSYLKQYNTGRENNTPISRVIEDAHDHKEFENAFKH